MKFYFDDIEEGITRKTSHPNFNSYLNDEFYINIIDEFAPFGNDEGWETLRALEKWYQNDSTQNKILIHFIDQRLYLWDWGLSHIQKLHVRNKEEIEAIFASHKYLLDIFPQILIATAFGQFKITGKINNWLIRTAILAIEQQTFITDYRIKDKEIDLSKLIKIVNSTSTRINSDGNMNHVLIINLERLNQLKAALQNVPNVYISKNDFDKGN